MGAYRKLLVWQRAHEVTLTVYRETRRWPGHERYGLTAQIRRAATSIGCNLAEGCGRNSKGELARFARIALGSANEVEYQLHLARDLGYLTGETATKLLSETAEIRRMLSGLGRRLNLNATRRPIGVVDS